MIDRPWFLLRIALIGLCAILACSGPAAAEPHLAVQKGMKCVLCHTSPSGGGKRTVYGNIFAQQELPAKFLNKAGTPPNFWDGKVFKYLAVGGDLRGGWSESRVPGQPTSSTTELEEFLAYAEVRLVPGYLSFHIDGKLRPDDPVVREQYLRLSLGNGRYYVKGGEFFLPYGLRLQDDSAFIRQVPGINYNTPDTGWEFGLERGNWSAQMAITRGTAGGPEVDSGKQYSTRVSYVRPTWRLGGSLNFNDARFGDRQMQNIFAGLKTGRISWLAELDYIIDDGTPTGRRKSWMSFLEANIAPWKGHNFRIAYEYYDPDVDVSEDQQDRISLVWEYFPIQFLQPRIGYRSYDGIPQNPAQNREQPFVELHIPF
jgi:hypothetical protein